jgi:4-amino-4-deoxy-L-arabinose transferase-like glycosyltransferase
MKLLGVNELTVHLPNLLYYFLLLAAMFFFLRRFANQKLAFYTTLITATSLCLVVYARSPKLDVLLTLFVMTAHFSLYALLKKDSPIYLILFTLSLSAGFLTKSGFGILLPALTILFLLIFNDFVRKKFLFVFFNYYTLISCLLFISMVGGILYLQSFALQDQWLPYLRSITIQSKYNTGYLGLGFHYPIVGFLLLVLFPWTPLWLSTLKIPWQRKNYPKLTLSDFCNTWFWSNIFFLLFFYQQNDLRTFTVFVPPLAILAGIKILQLSKNPLTKHRGFLWGAFLFAIFSIMLTALVLKPENPQGFSLKDALLPFALFTFCLLFLTFYLWKPSPPKFTGTFALVCFSYLVLFYNTKPIADAFNPDLTWPEIIKEQRNKGAKFYIYRPPDRPLFFSPDLFYVDFMAGPADRYFWDGEKLKRNLSKGKAIVLSDTKSWKKLKLKQGKIIAEDNYSCLIVVY